MSDYRLILGDSLAVLPTLADGSVQCCVTSPPYWGLRQYLFDKATVVRHDLGDDERAWLIAELARRGIMPRRADGSIQEGDSLATARGVS
jgi:DNA modification methylase